MQTKQRNELLSFENVLTFTRDNAAALGSPLVTGADPDWCCSDRTHDCTDVRERSVNAHAVRNSAEIASCEMNVENSLRK